jgi:hypothetical protein
MITFGGTTIYDCTIGGLNYTLNVSPINMTMIEKESPIGTGYFLKIKSREASDISLSMKFLTSDIDSIISTISDLDQTILSSLSTPDFPTYNNCRLVSFNSYEIEEIIPSTPKQYIINVDLTFRIYP